MCLILVEQAPGCSDGASVKVHVPEQKHCKNSCSITSETAEAEMKRGTSQYKTKNGQGTSRSRRRIKKTNRQPARSPKHLSKNSCTAKNELQPK